MKIVFLICAIVVLVSGCKKKPPVEEPVDDSDRTAPVITLKGKSKDTVTLGVVYVDPGATGIDDRDGDISPSIVVSGTVNKNQAGIYKIDYKLSDAAGNIAPKVERDVSVLNDAYYLAGEYNVACSCTTINPGVETTSASTTYTVNVRVSTIYNTSFSLSILNIGPAFVTPTTALNGTDIYVVYYSTSYPGGNLSGSVDVSKNGFTILTEAYDNFFTNKSYTCTNVFARK